ncbi:hypothetical protein GQF42_07795 [Streptomyces broussonetiae]|uniref:Uncharacterized protein n=1 Tax=Streptomyces broussonetiae TaxID=2686304 RepID=A0A6I6NN55_9ACTN|nr:hypothetical protein GQF42_07795 [Streptomyces broussonetiae]
MEQTEIDRLRAQDDFPQTLRDRVRVVGTAEGAQLMEIPGGRFTRLARLGLLVPVRWYLNRYRAVVWLYLAEDLRNFTAATENAHLLKGRTPESLRGQLEAGVDLRARNWRGRQLGFLLRQAEDPWIRAGAFAAFLGPVEVADIVKDPYDRSYVNRFRPVPPGQGNPGSPAAHLAERITTAQDADEIEWLRSELAHAVEAARIDSPAPRPAPRRPASAVRAYARPIPPLACTVTRPMEPRKRPSTQEDPPFVRPPESQAVSVTGALEPIGGLLGGALEPGDGPAAAAPTPISEQAASTPQVTDRLAAGVSEANKGPVFGAPWPDPGPVPRGAAGHRVSSARPSRPPVRRDRGPERAPAPSNRGLRGWLRRRSPRPARL